MIVAFAIALLLAGSAIGQDKADRRVVVTCNPLVTPEFDMCQNGEYLTIVNGCSNNIFVGFNDTLTTDTLVPGDSVLYGCTTGMPDCYTVKVPAKGGGYFMSKGCSETGALEAIPTLSEWGMIIFSLLILTLITVVVARRRTAGVAAGTGADVSISGPMFIPQVFVKTLTVTLGLAAVVLIVAGLLSQSLPLRDIAGTIISAGIIAYMAHLWVQPRRK